jgi:hypothetical protein
VSEATNNTVASLRRIVKATVTRDASTAPERKRLLAESRKSLAEARRLIQGVLENI